MPLEMRKSSRWWYGRFNASGNVYCKNLGIKIAGVRPNSISTQGDLRFEQSRAKAQAVLDQVISEANAKKHAGELVQTYHEIKTGRRITSVPLSALYMAWEKIPRKRKPCAAKCSWAKSVFQRFTSFVQATDDKIQDMASVKNNHATAFLASRKIAPSTWNAELSLLKGVFANLRREAGIDENPFDGIVTKDNDSFHRKPFEPEELKAIIDAAVNDDFCRPLIVTGACTALRRGDVCLLKWTNVDLPHRFITVKVAKTGVKVQIPMFPLLYDELSRLPHESEYCFPKQALMYQSNPYGVNYRLQKVFQSAGFADAEELSEDGSATHRDDVHAKREGGILRPNIRGFHAFRATWVTLALTAGVPIELVRRVTGHTVTQMVLDKYFQPGREQFRQTLQAAMPKLLTNGTPSKDEQALILLRGMKESNWQQMKDKAIAILTP